MVVDKKYPIRPEMIDTSRHLFNTFNDYNVEAAALWVIRLAQRRGSWEKFTADDINAAFGFGDFKLCLLLETKLIIENMGTYRVTHDLVAGAFLHHPVPYIGFRES